jgi:hypothetical protein
VSRPVKIEHVATFRSARHAAKAAGLDVYAQTRIMVTVKWAERRAPLPAPYKSDSRRLEVAQRFGKQSALET